MATLLAYVQRILGVVTQIVAIVTGISSAQSAQATSDEVVAIKADTEEIKLKINDSVFGLEQINTNVLAVITDLTADFDALTAQVAALQSTVDAGVTVTFIAAPVEDNIANAVWDFLDSVTARTTIQMLELTAMPPVYLGSIDSLELAIRAPWPWRVGGDWNATGAANPNEGTVIPLDVTTIIAADATSYDWIFRVYDGDLGGFLGDDGFYTVTDFVDANWNWVAYLPQSEFLQLKANLGLLSTNPTAPVWPGLSGVTLGTPVAISLSFTVDGPLQGVIVDLTAVPTLKGHYDYDGLSQSLKIGALTFVSDNGDAEYVQALGFTNEVYVPKNMSSATSCKVRAVSGVTGTVTPFTIP